MKEAPLTMYEKEKQRVGFLSGQIKVPEDFDLMGQEMRMAQLNFTDIEYSNRKKITKRDDFLRTMDEIIPWEEWISYIEPIYYKNKTGRPPRGIETMLRMYLLQA